MTELYTGTPQTTNVLGMLLQRKWAKEDQEAQKNTPANLLAAKQLETYDEERNYLTKEREQETKSKALQYEKDLTQYALDSLNQIDFAEYPQYRANLVRFGFNKGLLPESFSTAEEFQTWKSKAVLGYPEYQKLQNGEKATVSRVNQDGTISQAQVERDELKTYMDQGWQLGSLSGTPEKKQYEHKPVYNDKGRIIGWKSVEKGKDFSYPEGTYGSADGLQESSSKKSEMTASEALKRISDIEKARASLGETSEITALIAAVNPDLAARMGQQMTDKDKSALNGAWDEEIAYLRQFATKAPSANTTGAADAGAETAIPAEGATGTYNGRKVIVKGGQWVYAE